MSISRVIPRRATQWGRAVRAWTDHHATRLLANMLSRWQVVKARPEAGMATAEYAIATLAAVAFAGLLLVIMRSGEVREMLMGIIREALSR